MDIATDSTGRHARRLTLLVAGPILAAVALAGCGSQNGGSAASAGGSAARDGFVAGNTGNGQDAMGSTPANAAASPPRADVQQRQVISTGSIALTSSDLVSTRERLDAVLARDGGHIADENTTTDDHGIVRRTHLVVRVPSNRFDEAMTALSGVASLRSASRQAQDVTTRVIDLQARIRAEQAGVRRLRALVSHTASLGALLDVERALTQRQGDLESLQQQRAYLADQTGEATITVDVTRHTSPPTPPARAAGGFVGGLRQGWHGLVAVVDGFLVGLGVFLPFVAAGLLLGFPAWLLLRRLQRHRRRTAPVES